MLIRGLASCVLPPLLPLALPPPPPPPARSPPLLAAARPRSMVHTRSGAASPAVSRVRGAPPTPHLRQRATDADAPAPPAEQPAAAVPLRRAGFLALLCYLGWFVLILGGILAYEGGCRQRCPAGPGRSCCAWRPAPRRAAVAGPRRAPCTSPRWTLVPTPRPLPCPLPIAGEPILVKSRDLPLHWFDKLFRSLGSLLLFALWAVRAGAARLLPTHFDSRANLVFVPAALYAGQALIRLVIYQLHVAGGCWALGSLLGPAAGKRAGTRAVWPHPWRGRWCRSRRGGGSWLGTPRSGRCPCIAQQRASGTQSPTAQPPRTPCRLHLHAAAVCAGQPVPPAPCDE